MTDKTQLVGEYIIEKVEKDGSRKEVFRKHNHITPFLKWQILKNFSAYFNEADYVLGGMGGSLVGLSGLNYPKENQSYARYDRITNQLCLYGLNEVYENIEDMNKYPFTSNVKEVDNSKITFICSDSYVGDKYGLVTSTDRLNLSTPCLISKSWKITGPAGIGPIKTLCIGRNVHRTIPKDTTNINDYTIPYISKVLTQYYINPTTKEKYNITGYLPPIKDFSNKFYFGLGSTSSNNKPYKEYDIETDTFKDLTVGESDLFLAVLGTNVIKYEDFLYFTERESYTTITKFNTKDNTSTSLSLTGPSSYSNAIFKKGDKLILTREECNSNYETSYSSPRIYVYNLNVDGTPTQDTELFGSYNPYINSLINNKPDWFRCTSLGTRNDNENWLLHDNTKNICIECTDLQDVLGSMIDWYYTPSINNCTINNKLYFLHPLFFEELTAQLSSNISTGSLTKASKVPQIQEAGLATDMLSIITDIKDINGEDIVQTEDSEYIFTYNLRFL